MTMPLRRSTSQYPSGAPRRNAIVSLHVATPAPSVPCHAVTESHPAAPLRCLAFRRLAADALCAALPVLRPAVPSHCVLCYAVPLPHLSSPCDACAGLWPAMPWLRRTVPCPCETHLSRAAAMIHLAMPQRCRTDQDCAAAELHRTELYRCRTMPRPADALHASLRCADATRCNALHYH